jgi:hypothetical protein
MTSLHMTTCPRSHGLRWRSMLTADRSECFLLRQANTPAFDFAAADVLLSWPTNGAFFFPS